MEKAFCLSLPLFCITTKLFCRTKTSNFLATHYFYGGIVVCAHPIFCLLCSCSLLFFTATHFHFAGHSQYIRKCTEFTRISAAVLINFFSIFTRKGTAALSTPPPPMRRLFESGPFSSNDCNWQLTEFITFRANCYYI